MTIFIMPFNETFINFQRKLKEYNITKIAYNYISQIVVSKISNVGDYPIHEISWLNFTLPTKNSSRDSKVIEGMGKHIYFFVNIPSPIRVSRLVNRIHWHLYETYKMLINLIIALYIQVSHRYLKNKENGGN